MPKDTIMEDISNKNGIKHIENKQKMTEVSLPYL